jgi:hypothetical protein
MFERLMARAAELARERALRRRAEKVARARAVDDLKGRTT